MKHFIDIENIREEDVDLGNGIVRKNNIGAFKVGDYTVLQEKYDGQCASFSYDNGQLRAFSRKKELDYKNTSNGFWNYVQSLNSEDYKNEAGMIYFGEWTNRNKIKYDEKWNKHFLVFDIYDMNTETYQPQSYVKEQCKKHGLNYIHTFYEGEFISWEHVKSFMNSPQYGEKQEGVVIKNQTRLNSSDNRNPFYLKIANESFKESKKMREKDPQKEKDRADAQELISKIVTRNRVEKMISKMVNEGILPQEITPQDMRVVAKELPKRIYEDCVKEEPEVVQAAGQFGGKNISSLTMKLAREIVIGG